MYKFLGFVNIVLVVVIVSPYLLRKLNQWFFHTKSASFTKTQKVLRTVHKPAAALLLISIAVHGWLALGALRLHTGTVAGIFFLLTAVLGLLFYLMHKANLLKWHRTLALVAVITAIIHLVAPSLFYYMGIG